MNQQKIQEMSDQARSSVPKDILDVDEWIMKYNKIFAELIIRECADVLKKDMELAHIQLIPLDFKMYANGRLQRTIKERFGVDQ